MSSGSSLAESSVYGLFANGGRVRNIAHARELLAMPVTEPDDDQAGEAIEPTPPARPCPCCGGRMIVIETFEPQPRAPPYTPIQIATA